MNVLRTCFDTVAYCPTVSETAKPTTAVDPVENRLNPAQTPKARSGRPSIDPSTGKTTSVTALNSSTVPAA